MKLKIATCELHPLRPFRIARVRRHAVRNVFVGLEADGVTGFGEAAPSAYYDETAPGVLARLREAAPMLEGLRIRSGKDLAKTWARLWESLAPSRAAQCAVDLALWDWLGKQEGATAAELAWGAPARPVPTFCTIGLSTSEELEAKVREMHGLPMVKVKSDGSADLAPLRYVRDRSNAMIAVDANGAWTGIDLRALACELTRLEVAFIEQPLPPREHTRRLRFCCGLPLLADESCVLEEDVERISDLFDGFVVKLVKCGGLTPALRMVRKGHDLGLKTMVGCMLESSALIAAGAVAAQASKYADLDGAWLLGNDPFRGWQFQEGTLQPPVAPGLGVEPIAPLFESRGEARDYSLPEARAESNSDQNS